MYTESHDWLTPANVSVLEERTGLNLSMNWTYSWPEDEDTKEARLFIQWLRLMDRSFRTECGSDKPPIWIDEMFHSRWGPHDWPVRWQDVLNMEKVDCGVLQALTTAVYQMRGKTAYPVQLVLKFNDEAIRGWHSLWKSAGIEPDWCGNGVAYHEATLVVDEDSVGKIYDPMGRFFLRPRSPPGYEGIIAFRFQTEMIGSAPVSIEGIRVYPGVWYAVSEE